MNHETEVFIQTVLKSPAMRPVIDAFLLGYNDGLYWAAKWVKGSAKGNESQEVKEFAENMAMSLRAAFLRPPE
jgi:hypothetical protein